MNLENETEDKQIKVEVEAEEQVLPSPISSLPKLKISYDVENNNAAEWKKWWQQIELYMLTTGLDKETEKRKIAILLTSMGNKGLDIYNSFNIDMDSSTLAAVKDRFDNYFQPSKNLTMIRYKFFSRKQNSSESIDEFIKDLENLSTDCEFDSLKESLVRDIFIANMRSSHIRQRLLQDPDLQLEKAIEIAKTIIMAQQNSEKNDDSESNVSGNTKYQQNNRKSSHVRPGFAAMSTRGGTPGWAPSQRNRYNYQSESQSFPNQGNWNNQQSMSSPIDPCGRCGQMHRFKCPAASVQCRSCDAFGHFAKFCFKSKKFRYE